MNGTIWRAVRTVAAAIGWGCIAAVVLYVVLAGESRAQTPEPTRGQLPALPAKLSQLCAPGFGLGKPWVGSGWDDPTQPHEGGARYDVRTDNGWYAYAWCAADTDSLPRFVLKVCAHGPDSGTDGGCKTQVEYWATVAQLLIGAVTKPRLQVVSEWHAANPPAYICPIYPSGGAAPPQRPKAPFYPDAGTRRAGICADGLKALQATWPTIPYSAPVPAPTPVPGWTAYGGAIFKHAAGKLTTVVSGKTAAKGAACTGVTVATAGTFTYQPLVNGPADEATRCVKP